MIEAASLFIHRTEDVASHDAHDLMWCKRYCKKCKKNMMYKKCCAVMGLRRCVNAKKKCFRPGSNRGPCACEAHVITATLRKRRPAMHLLCDTHLVEHDCVKGNRLAACYTVRGEVFRTRPDLPRSLSPAGKAVEACR